MTDRQTAFFRALLEPFPRDAYKDKNGYTYIKARTIKNRLDDIVGPMGWTAEYTATDRGYKCRLKLLCPDHTDNGWAWHYKEDGGGFEDMGSRDKKTQQWETDQDNDEKAAYTNSFRRAAAEWGFGRELYREGVPRWLADLYPDAGICTPADAPPAYRPDDRRVENVGRAVTNGHGNVDEPRRPPAPAPRTAPAPVNGHGGQHKKNLNQPENPRAFYPWMKQLEEHFGIELVTNVNKYAKKNFGTWDTRELSPDQLHELGGWLIEQTKRLTVYNGEFDKPEDYVPDEPGYAQSRAPHRADLGGIKRAILAAVKAVVTRQTGREATLEEQMSAVGAIAAATKNGKGYTGEVLDSLKDCQDKTWLDNMLTEANRQMMVQANRKPEPVAAAKTSSDDMDYEDPDDTPF